MSKIPFYEDEELREIIKRGEERARFGQTNSRATATPFQSKRQVRPKHWMSRKVVELISDIEMQKFKAMSDVERWHQLDEIKVLAISQVRDDWGKTPFQKFGKHNMVPVNDELEVEPFWPDLTKVQLALEEGLAPFVAALTEVQQQTVRMRHWQRLSQSEVGKELGVSKKSVEMNETRAYTSLKKKLLTRFIEEAENALLSATQ